MSKRMVVLICSIFLIVPLLFMGCGSGSDGSNGAAGATGATGATGPPGPVSNTNESCTVCHTTGRIADITDASATGVHYNAAYSLPSVTVDTVVVDNVGGVPTVSFHVTSGGNPVTTIDNASVSFMMADLVPAGTVDNTANRSTAQFELWAYERVGTIHGTTTPSPSAPSMPRTPSTAITCTRLPDSFRCAGQHRHRTGL